MKPIGTIEKFKARLVPLDTTVVFWAKRYCVAERWGAISGLTIVALFAYIYAYRCVYAYNERCLLSQGQTEGDPRVAGVFFFPLLIPIALAIRTRLWLRLVSVLSVVVAIAELPAILNEPDIATGCFGMGGDHDDQEASLQGWALLALFCAAIAYSGIALGWLRTMLKKFFPQVNWD